MGAVVALWAVNPNQCSTEEKQNLLHTFGELLEKHSSPGA